MVGDVDDLDIAKRYINGRFGATPFIKKVKQFTWEQ
jgi:hypothetical protein